MTAMLFFTFSFYLFTSFLFAPLDMVGEGGYTDP
jgi:hypothetical protein